MTIKGIDVSNYQSPTYPLDGFDFVIVKATEGTGYVNPRHAAQINRGRDHGLVVGHYHFVHDGNLSAQVDYFLKHAAPQHGEFLALDWESGPVSSAEKDQFLKALRAKAGGRRVLLYCNTDYWKHHDTSSYAADGLWIAEYNGRPGHPSIDAKWLLHQYTSTPLDTSVAAFPSRAAMAQWAGATPPRPAHEPFPGAAWFHTGRKSPIVAAMHARLVAVGCNHYQSTANKDVIGSGDIASYEAWQRKCGHSGKAATWPPGKETWDRLQVPNV